MTNDESVNKLIGLFVYHRGKGRISGPQSSLNTTHASSSSTSDSTSFSSSPMEVEGETGTEKEREKDNNEDKESCKDKDGDSEKDKDKMDTASNKGAHYSFLTYS